MGQTLSHGVYLPAEGERNCYSGLASNWQILNTAVGAIAEKAPLVHTHGNISNDGKVGTTANLPLITGTGGAVQAGAFGNSANTFCEGNDSRLSDARTPVTHTHTKADITDLLNSNCIPSANNSYDLGSSSYQWKSVYAQSYYYNGTPWGLDKQNTWTNFQRMTSNPAVWYLRNDTVTLGTAPASNRYIGMFFEDVNGADLGYVSFQANKNSYNSIMFSLRNFDGTNAYTGALRYRASTTGDYCFFPETSECDLGTSTSKWKTLNGINPGALSLPDIAKYTDLTSNIPSASLDGTTEINLSSYITTKGWLAIVVPDTNTDDFVFCQNGSTLSNRYFMSGARGNGFISLMMPINNTGEVKVQIKASSVSFCRFYPGLGNV